MKQVTIYTTMTCPYCYKAKGLFKDLGIAEKAGKTSVPQIWFNEDHIGGCDDLHALHEAGSLMESLS